MIFAFIWTSWHCVDYSTGGHSNNSIIMEQILKNLLVLHSIVPGNWKILATRVLEFDTFSFFHSHYLSVSLIYINGNATASASHYYQIVRSSDLHIFNDIFKFKQKFWKYFFWKSTQKFTMLQSINNVIKINSTVYSDILSSIYTLNKMLWDATHLHLLNLEHLIAAEFKLILELMCAHIIESSHNASVEQFCGRTVEEVLCKHGTIILQDVITQ